MHRCPFSTVTKPAVVSHTDQQGFSSLQRTWRCLHSLQPLRLRV
jgi:hypothetical protein